MKKIKLTSKLSLNKHVISKLNEVKGGAEIETSYRYACNKSAKEYCGPPRQSDWCK